MSTFTIGPDEATETVYDFGIGEVQGLLAQLPPPGYGGSDSRRDALLRDLARREALQREALAAPDDVGALLFEIGRLDESGLPAAAIAYRKEELQAQVDALHATVREAAAAEPVEPPPTRAAELEAEREQLRHEIIVDGADHAARLGEIEAELGEVRRQDGELREEEARRHARADADVRREGREAAEAREVRLEEATSQQADVLAEVLEFVASMRDSLTALLASERLVQTELDTSAGAGLAGQLAAVVITALSQAGVSAYYLPGLPTNSRQAQLLDIYPLRPASDFGAGHVSGGGRSCTVCSHPERRQIEAQLRSGKRPGAVAAAFDVGRDALRRHCNWKDADTQAADVSS